MRCSGTCRSWPCPVRSDRRACEEIKREDGSLHRLFGRSAYPFAACLVRSVVPHYQLTVNTRGGKDMLAFFTPGVLQRARRTPTVFVSVIRNERTKRPWNFCSATLQKCQRTTLCCFWCCAGVLTGDKMCRSVCHAALFQTRRHGRLSFKASWLKLSFT